MSELTQCNFCSWSWYKKKYGDRVKLGSGTSKPWDKLSISYPSSQTVILDGKEVIGWLAELTDHCVC